MRPHNECLSDELLALIARFEVATAERRRLTSELQDTAHTSRELIEEMRRGDSQEQPSGGWVAVTHREASMTDAEKKVMQIFHFYRVAPYQMLCLNGRVQEDLHVPLDRLIERGFIVREGHHDAYHLTSIGYQVASRISSAE
jgi:hypothetical protein